MKIEIKGNRKCEIWIDGNLFRSVVGKNYANALAHKHAKTKGLTRDQYTIEKITPPPVIKEVSPVTCQICGYHIMASKGVIAHHGYTRPGHGWQTGSCFGARFAPYEVSKDKLEDYITGLTDYLGRTLKRLQNVANEGSPISFTFSLSFRKGEEQTLELTRENWEAKKAENTLAFHRFSSLRDFDTLKKSEINRVQFEITAIENDLKTCRERANVWKVTKAFQNGTWVNV